MEFVIEIRNQKDKILKSFVSFFDNSEWPIPSLIYPEDSENDLIKSAISYPKDEKGC